MSDGVLLARIEARKDIVGRTIEAHVVRAVTSQSGFEMNCWWMLAAEDAPYVPGEIRDLKGVVSEVREGENEEWTIVTLCPMRSPNGKILFKHEILATCDEDLKFLADSARFLEGVA